MGRDLQLLDRCAANRILPCVLRQPQSFFGSEFRQKLWDAASLLDHQGWMDSL